MNRLTVFLLVFVSLINSPVIAEQKPVEKYVTQKCIQYGTSRSCDHELDNQELNHPTDTYTNTEALQAIKEGYGTPEQFYQQQTITLQQKQWLELQLTPERL